MHYRKFSWFLYTYGLSLSPEKRGNFLKLSRMSDFFGEHPIQESDYSLCASLHPLIIDSILTSLVQFKGISSSTFHSVFINDLKEK
jgi:hypothetical protein